MKRILKWSAAVLVIGLLSFGIVRTLSAKKAQQTAAAALAAKPAASSIELAPTDLVKVQTRELSQGLAISGALKAANSAFIKARVAGELQDLKVREGDWVKAGQVVARVDSTDSVLRIKQAQEQADAARSQIDIAQRQFDNNRSLVEQGFISKTSLDTSSAQLLGAQATHKAALAQVELAKKALDDTILRSPIAGQVAQRLAQPGERVGVDARVLEVVDLSRLELEASLSAADSVSVKVGQTALLRIEGVAQPLAATVARINPSAQAGSRSVLAYLVISQGAAAGSGIGLRQGLFAQGVLGTDRQSALTLPVSAVRTDKPVPYVQLVEGNQVVHRAVQTGARGESAGERSGETAGEALVAVVGLAEGDSVVKGSLGQLREGTLVKMSAARNATPAAAAATSTNTSR
jgi:membrane fusion protein, multidrug efflux system